MFRYLFIDLISVSMPSIARTTAPLAAPLPLSPLAAEDRSIPSANVCMSLAKASITSVASSEFFVIAFMKSRELNSSSPLFPKSVEVVLKPI